MAAVEDENRPGKPSPFACPECGGVLWVLDGEPMPRFRCRVGHAYTASSLSIEQWEKTEAALWAAMRALEEGAALARRMADSAAHSRQTLAERRYRERAEDKMEQAKVLRNLIVESKDVPVQLDQDILPANFMKRSNA